MKRHYYLDLAASGLRMPVATHLILHEHADAKQIMSDGRRLGQVLEETARRYKTPIAVPLMDLTLEKAALLTAMGVAEKEIDSYHFDEPPVSHPDVRLTPRMVATCDALRYIATETDLLPVGMSIGPFSLMTKLIADPISPVYLAETGASREEEPEIAIVEETLKLALEVILFYIKSQIEAGAKAIFLCEPAANIVYFSPSMLEKSYDVFDRYVLEPNRQIKELLENHDVDLIFHDCGELTDEMIRRFASLDPAMLSLGSSRKLWQDAALLPKTTVLYGNLPSKHFYSDEQMSVIKVRTLAEELLEKMSATGHPFILGSECDILSVPQCEVGIRSKVDAFMQCRCSSLNPA